MESPSSRPPTTCTALPNYAASLDSRTHRTYRTHTNVLSRSLSLSLALRTTTSNDAATCFDYCTCAPRWVSVLVQTATMLAPIMTLLYSDPILTWKTYLPLDATLAEQLDAKQNTPVDIGVSEFSTGAYSPSMCTPFVALVELASITISQHSLEPIASLISSSLLVRAPPRDSCMCSASLRSCRRRCLDRSMELSAVDGLMEGRSRSRRWLHHRTQGTFSVGLIVLGMVSLSLTNGRSLIVCLRAVACVCV